MSQFFLRSRKFRETLQQVFGNSIPNGITFASGKGGVGKTLLAANFAFSFAERGIRTLIIDGDCGLANLDIALGVLVKFTLEDVLQRKVPLMEAVVQTRYPGLSLLPASSGKILDWTDPDAFQDIREIFDQWDLVVVDAPAGASTAVSHWSFLTRWTAVVVNEEKTSLTDAYALMKILKKQGYNGLFQLVANRVSSEEGGLRLFERFSKVVHDFLEIPMGFLGSVPEDQQLKVSLEQRRLCASEFPFSTSSQAVRRLVASFCALVESESQDLQTNLAPSFQKFKRFPVGGQ